MGNNEILGIRNNLKDNRLSVFRGAGEMSLHQPGAVDENLRQEPLPSNETPLWFAMSATFGRSMRAKERLEQLGIDNYVPMRYEVTAGSRGRQDRRLIPAINNLIFVRTTRAIIQSAKQQIDWLQYLTQHESGKQRPIIVPDRQMEQFILVTQNRLEDIAYLTPEQIASSKGHRVRIIGGPFHNVEGLVLHTRGSGRKKLIVDIPNIIAARTEIADYDLIELLS